MGYFCFYVPEHGFVFSLKMLGVVFQFRANMVNLILPYLLSEVMLSIYNENKDTFNQYVAFCNIYGKAIASLHRYIAKV